MLTRLRRFVRSLPRSWRQSAAPRRRVFHSASHSRLTSDFFSSNTSGRQEVEQDLKTLRHRSRTLFRDTPIAKRYGNLFAENVAGHEGIQLQPRALLANGELDKVLNQKIRDAWELFTEPANCTRDGKLGWAAMLQHLDRLEPMDGEILMQLVPGSDNAFGFAVQVMDPDQLDVDYRVAELQNGNEIVQGVEFNRDGKPVAYHIWERHPRDPRRGERKRIPAEFIIHDFIPFRPGAARGIPWLHAAIEQVHMLNGYAEAELVIARLGANRGGYWKPSDEDSDDGDGETEPELPAESQPGLFDVAPPGWTWESYDNDHPATNFPGFLKAITRLTATGGNVAYSSLSGDLEAVNFSSIRAGLLSERDFFRARQKQRIDAVCQRIYRAWLPMAQLSGALKITSDELTRARRVQWRPRGFPWVDPLNDMQTAEREVRLGVNSRRRIAADRGRELHDIAEELDAENQLATEYEIDISGTEGPPQQPMIEPQPNPTDGTQTNTGKGRTLRIG